jgi:uncharacterized protein with NAD-binding domain and iron-sulfur cluster
MSDEASPSEKKQPSVDIFGSGIAGLTAAHELALRGFKVRVFERDSAVDQEGRRALAMGGLARTQYFQADPDQKVYFHESPQQPSSLGAQQASESHHPFPALWLEFEGPDGQQALTSRSQEELDHALDRLKRSSPSLGQFTLRIQGFYDRDLHEVQTQGLSTRLGASREKDDAWYRVRYLQERIQEQLPTAAFTPHDLRPASAALGQPPIGRLWVRLVVDRTMLPGEHGFRYFPSYYRHVFDTMRRIPRYDDHGHPAHGTVQDNLVAVPYIGITSHQALPFVMAWKPSEPFSSLSGATRNQRDLGSLGVTPQDLSQFSLRILRYMLTCPERRARDLENVSWWEYLLGRNSATSPPLYRYSQAFEDFVKTSGRVLVALDGQWGDARTTANTYVQLLRDVLLPTERQHATLDSPTSESWFTHWRLHLERLGVEFRLGELDPLELDSTGKLKVSIDKGSGANFSATDYFLVATDVVSAEKLVERLPSVGVAGELKGYTTLASEAAGAPGTYRRNPETAPGYTPWDRLQTLSGIQYFFTAKVNLFEGYLYCSDAPWGLSGISSHITWSHPPIEGLNHYQSIFSVDIGEWTQPAHPPHGKTAWDSSPKELAEETWNQLQTSLQVKDEHGGAYDRFHPPLPDYAHIDEGLVFNAKGQLLCNKTPFLLPTVGDWQYRPGADPWNPTPGTRSPPGDAPLPEGLWQAEHGGYWVHWDQLVFAGTFTRTFTRLTTMESANESARHAVNAILDHCSDRARHPEARAQGPQRLHAEREKFFPSTPHGDYCRIWDPEHNELPDLELFRRLDEYNFKLGLPHPWDLLGVELLPSLLSNLSQPGSPPAAGVTDPFATTESLLRELTRQGGAGAGSGLLEVLRRIRTGLEENLKRGGYPPASP